MEQIKRMVKRVPIIGPLLSAFLTLVRKATFPGIHDYWESRYIRGGTSGPGSYGRLAEFKAKVLNSFVSEQQIQSVIEFGCGDGNQLSLATYPIYIGLDVSKTAIKLCKERFQNDLAKSFFLHDSECFVDRHSVFRAELAISLDVIFHLVDDDIYELYLTHLFSAAEKYVIIYSSDTDVNPSIQGPSYRNRRFSEWIQAKVPEWKLLRKIPNQYPLEENEHTGSPSDFFIYEKV